MSGWSLAVFLKEDRANMKVSASNERHLPLHFKLQADSQQMGLEHSTAFRYFSLVHHILLYQIHPEGGNTLLR